MDNPRNRSTLNMRGKVIHFGDGIQATDTMHLIGRCAR